MKNKAAGVMSAAFLVTSAALFKCRSHFIIDWNETSCPPTFDARVFGGRFCAGGRLAGAGGFEADRDLADGGSRYGRDHSAAGKGRDDQGS